MKELKDLINIGEEIQRQLHSVGIFDYDELKSIGAEEAWLRIKQKDPSACFNRLLALEGAIQGVKKMFLQENRKEELKQFYNLHKR